MSDPLVLAITGASGAVYAVRLLELLVDLGRDVHLTISSSGATVLAQELDIAIDLTEFHPRQLALHEVRRAAFWGDRPRRAPQRANPGKVTYFHYQDFLAPLASGSAKSAGMVVCPCSGGTLSAIAHAAGGNLIQRAADVHLKERRKLILVPRETPLSAPQLENMHRAAQAGAVILPAMPGWYHGVERPGDLIDFVVGRILDQLDVEHTLLRRWGS